MKTAIIGIGKMGNFHAKTVLNHPDFFLTGVYDIDQQKSIEYIETQKKLGYDLKAFNDIEEVVLNNDSVIISTPATTHYDVIKSFYKHGSIHILCEKPLTSNIDDYDTLFFQNLSSLNVLQIGLCERHGELINFLKPIDFDKIEKLTFVRHNTSNRNTDVNIIWDTMIHDIDLLYYLFPMVNIKKIKIKKSDYIDDNLKHLVCSCDRGKYIFDCAKGMDKAQRYLEIKLLDGTFLKYDFIKLTIDYGVKDAVILTATIQQNIQDKLTIQLDNFLNSIRGYSSNNANLFDTNRTMFLTNMIDKQVKKEL